MPIGAIVVMNVIEVTNHLLIGFKALITVLYKPQQLMTGPVKSTCSFCTGPGFNFQHLHGSSQSSLPPVSGDLTLLLASTGTAHTRGTGIRETKYPCS